VAASAATPDQVAQLALAGRHQPLQLVPEKHFVPAAGTVQEHNAALSLRQFLEQRADGRDADSTGNQ